MGTGEDYLNKAPVTGNHLNEGKINVPTCCEWFHEADGNCKENDC